MTAQEWGILIGTLLSVGLALTPWMFMVHARLAVLTAQINSLEGKVDKLIQAYEQQLPASAVHAASLKALELRVTRLEEHLRMPGKAPVASEL